MGSVPTFPKQEQVIGIVGGLGPYAHIVFEQMLLDAAAELLGAHADQEFPHWRVSSMPQTPDRTRSILGLGPDPTPWMVQSLRSLAARTTADGHSVRGADFAVIVCNTSHHFLDKLREQSPIPIVDMIGETCRFVKRTYPGTCVGLLATTGTLTSGLYHRPLERHGLGVVSPLDLRNAEDTQQRLVMKAIYGEDGTRSGIKGVGPLPAHQRLLERAADVLIRDGGADVIVAGCTEVSATLSGGAICARPLVDPMRVVARVSISRAYGLET